MVEELCERYADEYVFTCMDKNLTYKQLDKLSTHFGGYLLSIGVNPGDKVALMMPNLLQYPIAFFGCLKAGMVVVNTNPLYTPREMKHQFNDSGVKAIVICENFAHHLQTIKDETSITHVIITSIGELLGLIKGTITDFVVRKIRKMVPEYTVVAVTFHQALKIGVRYPTETHDG